MKKWIVFCVVSLLRVGPVTSMELRFPVTDKGVVEPKREFFGSQEELSPKQKKKSAMAKIILTNNKSIEGTFLSETGLRKLLGNSEILISKKKQYGVDIHTYSSGGIGGRIIGRVFIDEAFVNKTNYEKGKKILKEIYFPVHIDCFSDTFSSRQILEIVKSVETISSLVLWGLGKSPELTPDVFDRKDLRSNGKGITIAFKVSNTLYECLLDEEKTYFAFPFVFEDWDRFKKAGIDWIHQTRMSFEGWVEAANERRNAVPLEYQGRITKIVEIFEKLK